MNDDETGGITLSRSSLSVGEGGSGTYTVRLSKEPASSVTVNVSSSATGVATVSDSALTFTAANWDTAQTVTVSGVDDDVFQVGSNRSATITHSATGYPSSALAVTVIDNEDSVPSFSGTVSDQIYTVGTSVLVVLPEAAEGGEVLTYGLSPQLPPELTFNAQTREIRGTPTEVREKTEYVYTVTDSDGDIDTLMFTVTVRPGLPLHVGQPEVAAGNRQLGVSWEEPEDNGSPIMEYAVQWKVSTGDEWTGAAKTEGTAYTIEGLEDGMKYAVRVRARNGVGEGDWSPEAFGTTFRENLLSSKTLKVVLSAFARVVAAGAVEAIGERIKGSLRKTRAMLAGIPLGGEILNRLPVRLAGGMPAAPGVLREEEGPARIDLPSGKDVLEGSEFELYPPGDEEESPGWSVWGWGRAGGFENRRDMISVDGEVFSAYIGMDIRPHSSLLVGVAASWNIGEMNYMNDEEDSGEVDASLVSLMPYMVWEPHERLSVWGLGGLGTGKLTVRRGDRANADMSMRLAGAGMSYDLLRRVFDWDLKADAFAVKVNSDEAPGLHEASGSARRLRLALTGERELSVGVGKSLFPGVEFGFRYDDGDAGSGGGFELGGGLGYEDESLGFIVETQARVLVAHQEEGFSEWGAGLSLRYDPGIRDRGLMIVLAPRWGQVESGVDKLWNSDQFRTEQDYGVARAGRLTGEVSYNGSQFTPFAAVEFLKGGHGLGAGVRVGATDGLDLRVAALRKDLGVGPVNHGIQIQAALRF